jgi:O-antigen/teichoic acid export membrane protein
MKKLNIKKVVQNGIVNVALQVIPVISALALIPFNISHYGKDIWGVYTLAITGIILYNYFDLGMSPAITYTLSKSLGNKNGVKRCSEIIGSAVIINLALSAIFVSLLILNKEELISVLVDGKNLRNLYETLYAYFVLITPIALLNSLLKSAAESLQRYYVIASLRAIVSASVFVAPAIAAIFENEIGYSFHIIIFVYLFSIASFVALIQRELGVSPLSYRYSTKSLKKLFSYGKWMAIYSALLPLFMYFDRYYIGSTIGESAVTYYTVALDLVSRLTLISGSFTSAFFAAVPYWSSGKGQTNVEKSYKQSFELLTICITPIVIIFISFSYTVLEVWVGKNIAEESAIVLQIVSVGVLFNCVSSIPMRLLNGIGKPWLPALLLVAEIPLYVYGLMATSMGDSIIGIAGLYAARTFIDMCFLVYISDWHLRADPNEKVWSPVPATFKLIIVSILIMSVTLILGKTTKVSTQFLLAILLSITFVIAFKEEIKNIKWKTLSAFLR